LAAAYGDRILRLSYSILGDRALAEDVSQDVLLRIWRALPLYRGEALLSTWIFAIARNTSLSALAKSKRRAALSLSEPAVKARAESRAQGPDRSSDHADILRFVAQLPEHLRKVTMLFYMEGKSYEQVAESLGLPLGTVKSHLFRARKSLTEAVVTKEKT
jgi:RNA polymerase sigma-70 factor (ECF subfamily)